MKRYALIGTHIDQSLSPAIYRPLFERYGMDAAYDLMPVAPGGLAQFLDYAREELAGFNVTMPFKQEILPYLDEMDGETRRCASCNVVVVKNGRLIGHSTDADGFLESLRLFGVGIYGANVLLIGAGGAAYAIALGMVDAGASLIVCNRSESKARALADFVQKQTGERCLSAPLTDEALALYAPEAQLIVNATSLGMQGKEGFASLDFLREFHGAVSDLVYVPAQTQLLQEAQRLELKAVGGVYMLICQAFLSFRHFTGRRTTVEDFDYIHKRVGAIIAQREAGGTA